MYFNAETDRFELSEITFAGDTARMESSLRQESSHETDHNGNPLECLRCHGNDLRPLWEDYAHSRRANEGTWPGALGGHDDNYLQIEETIYEGRDQIPYTRPAVDQRTQLGHIISLVQTHPRYRSLILNPGFGQLETGTTFRRNKTRNNVYYTNRIIRQNFKRVARLISQQPFYLEYRYFLIHLMSCRMGSQQSLSQYLSSMVPTIDGVNSELIFTILFGNLEEYEKNNPLSGQRFGNYSSVESLMTFFEAKGIPTFEWGTNLEPFYHFGMNPVINGPNDAPINRIAAHLISQDPMLTEFVGAQIPLVSYLNEITEISSELNGPIYRSISCEQLKVRAKQSLASYIEENYPQLIRNQEGEVHNNFNQEPTCEGNPDGSISSVSNSQIDLISQTLSSLAGPIIHPHPKIPPLCLSCHNSQAEYPIDAFGLTTDGFEEAIRENNGALARTLLDKVQSGQMPPSSIEGGERNHYERIYQSEFLQLLNDALPR